MARPLLWITIAFATGILSASRYAIPAGTLLVPVAGLYIIWLVSLWALPLGGDGPVRTALALAVFAALGYLTAVADPIHQQSAVAAAWDGRRGLVEGLISGPIEERDGRQRARVLIRRVDGRELPIPFVALASFPVSPTLAYGDLISARASMVLPPEAGNPGEPSLRAAFRRQGIVALLRGPGHVTVVQRDQGSTLLRMTLRLRQRLMRPLLALPPPYGGVLAGLLLGVEAGVDDDMAQVFRRAGLLHVLVVSGGQVGLVAASVLGVAARLRLRAWGQALLAGIVVLLFSMMAGWSPSVGRAALMALAGLGALALRRDTDAPSILAFAALVWLALHPQALFSLGFQLSFAATCGLLFLRPLLTPPIRPHWLAELAGASFGAQVAVLPILAVVFQQISLAAFPANLLVLPVVAVVVPAGFALILAGAALPSLAAALAPALLPLVWVIVAAARLFASAPGAQVWLPRPISAIHALLAYAALGGMITAHRGRVAARTLTLSALIVVTILTLDGLAEQRLRGPTLLVAALDVGQGDAILVRGPTGRTMLVDAGGEVEVGGTSRSLQTSQSREMSRSHEIGARRVVPALRRLGVRRLDVVMISHAHEDHVGGLPAVLDSFSVDLIIDPGVPHTSPSYVAVLEMVRAMRIPYALGRAGQRIDLGGGAVADLLNPTDDGSPPVPPGNLIHARAIAARVTFGDISVLLTGDIESETESLLIERGLPRSTVLKVAHHGSRTSTTLAFLDAVRPRLAIISVGRDNPFGHPHAQTLRALSSRGIHVFRTDRHGAVLLRTDGRGLTVETMREDAPVLEPQS